MKNESFIKLAEEMPHAMLAGILNMTENQIIECERNDTLTKHIAALYDNSSTEQIERLTDEMTDYLRRRYTLNHRNNNACNETPSRSSVMILCVCIGAFLGAITMVLVPAEYRPSSAPIDENTEITFGLMMEQMMTIQGLVGLLPITYFLIALLIAKLLQRKFA